MPSVAESLVCTLCWTVNQQKECCAKHSIRVESNSIVIEDGRVVDCQAAPYRNKALTLQQDGCGYVLKCNNTVACAMRRSVQTHVCGVPTPEQVRKHPEYQAMFLNLSQVQAELTALVQATREVTYLGRKVCRKGYGPEQGTIVGIERSAESPEVTIYRVLFQESVTALTWRAEKLDFL